MTVRGKRKVSSLSPGLVDSTLHASHLISDLLFTGQEILPKGDSAASLPLFISLRKKHLRLVLHLSSSLFIVPSTSPIFCGFFAHAVSSCWL